MEVWGIAAMQSTDVISDLSAMEPQEICGFGPSVIHCGLRRAAKHLLWAALQSADVAAVFCCGVGSGRGGDCCVGGRRDCEDYQFHCAAAGGCEVVSCKQ